jgi:hypothetical protein
MSLNLVIEKLPTGDWEDLLVFGPNGEQATVHIVSTSPFKLRLNQRRPQHQVRPRQRG